MLNLRRTNKSFWSSLLRERPQALLSIFYIYIVSFAAIFGCSIPWLITPFLSRVINICHLKGRERIHFDIAHELVPPLRIVRYMYDRFCSISFVVSTIVSYCSLTISESICWLRADRTLDPWQKYRWWDW